MLLACFERVQPFVRMDSPAKTVAFLSKHNNTFSLYSGSRCSPRDIKYEARLIRHCRARGKGLPYGGKSAQWT
jgi:hypothetical protein